MPGRRRVRGIAPRSIFTALLIAANIRKIGSEDGPPTPAAGNVRTQRATCGIVLIVIPLQRVSGH